MKERPLKACGLILATALVTAPHAALATSPKHKKATRAAPAEKVKKSDKVELDDTPAPAAEEPQPIANEAPPPAAAPPTAAAHDTPAPTPPRETAATAEVEAASPPPSQQEPLSDTEAELGRREARRIAAGRIGVGVWLVGGVANRRFTYSDAVGDNLANYRLPAAPMATFGLEAYPAASTDIPVLRDLGVRAHVSRGFAFDSDTPQGVTIETSWTRFGGELRERLLLPGPHAFELGVLLGADASWFGMTAKAPVPALLPAARTVALRFGLDARLLLGWRLSVLAGGGYLYTTSRGDIYEHFRKPRVQGLDADFGFAVRLEAGLELVLLGRYTRYFASFRPVLGDRYVAGGALDEQLQAGIGARYAH
ncbi:MAG TPA: hypothetical protein VHB79_08970 [Polyangiaceae bacterium]|nr:hypothetical protein [Polyangiaceae bacterium]